MDCVQLRTHCNTHAVGRSVGCVRGTRYVAEAVDSTIVGARFAKKYIVVGVGLLGGRGGQGTYFALCFTALMSRISRTSSTFAMYLQGLGSNKTGCERAAGKDIHTLC